MRRSRHSGFSATFAAANRSQFKVWIRVPPIVIYVCLRKLQRYIKFGNRATATKISGDSDKNVVIQTNHHHIYHVQQLQNIMDVVDEMLPLRDLFETGVLCVLFAVLYRFVLCTTHEHNQITAIMTTDLRMNFLVEWTVYTCT